MRRTERLQEIRKMRFEEVYGEWTESRLSQEEAARGGYAFGRSGATEIDTKRADKRLTQASFRCAPVDEVMAVAQAVRASTPGLEGEAFLYVVSA